MRDTFQDWYRSAQAGRSVLAQTAWLPEGCPARCSARCFAGPEHSCAAEPVSPDQPQFFGKELIHAALILFISQVLASFGLGNSLPDSLSLTATNARSEEHTSELQS